MLVCLVVGGGTYLFRYLPARAGGRVRAARGRLGDLVERFIGNVGIAAVTVLLVASALDLPGAAAGAQQPAPLLAAGAGFLVVLVSYYWRRSVALSTLAGAAAYGVFWWLLAGLLR